MATINITAALQVISVTDSSDMATKVRRCALVEKITSLKRCRKRCQRLRWRYMAGSCEEWR